MHKFILVLECLMGREHIVILILSGQDEAFNTVAGGESSDESEIESISPVKSELNRALDLFKRKNREETGKRL